VLALSLNAEKSLFHQRAPELVNMAKQLGRAGSCPPMFDEASDDFEELVLDPRPVQRRVPVYVDMAKAAGRLERLDLSAHIWADEDGKVYAYQPTAGLRLREEGADELELKPERGRRLVDKTPQGTNFSHALGRPGIDPRVAECNVNEDGDEVIFTHWRPRVRSRPPPSRLDRSSAADVSTDVHLAESVEAPAMVEPSAAELPLPPQASDTGPDFAAVPAATAEASTIADS
jgi:hypothetical protein